MIPQKLIRAAATWALGLFLILSITALAEKLAPDQKQPLDRSSDAQVAEIPTRLGNLQMQPTPLVPKLVGTNLGVELEPNNTFGTANPLGANPEGKIKGNNLSGGPPLLPEPMKIGIHLPPRWQVPRSMPQPLPLSPAAAPTPFWRS